TGLVPAGTVSGAQSEVETRRRGKLSARAVGRSQQRGSAHLARRSVQERRSRLPGPELLRGRDQDPAGKPAGEEPHSGVEEALIAMCGVTSAVCSLQFSVRM